MFLFLSKQWSKFDDFSYSEEKINKFIKKTENYIVNKSLIYKDKKLKIKINETLYDMTEALKF